MAGGSKQAGGNKQTWVCNQCNLKYDDKKLQKWVECDLCDKKYDTKCQGISDPEYNCMSRADLLWICPTCLPEIKTLKEGPKTLKELLHINTSLLDGIEYLKTSTHNILKQQVEMEKNRNSISEQIDTNLRTFGEKISEGIDGVKDAVKKDIPKLWSEVAKSTKIGNNTPVPSTIDMVHTVKKAISEIAESEKEEEVRSRGIVIYRVPEQEGETKEARVHDDRTVVEELLDHIGCSEAEVVYAERLGQFNSERCEERKFRPIKVRLSKQEDREKILKNLYKLRTADENIKNLSIRQDLNNAQRAELRQITDEAIQKSRESTTWHYRVKGGPGNYKLVQVAKKYPLNA